jgi:regulator of cell morphogenesis and NO signaling
MPPLRLPLAPITAERTVHEVALQAPATLAVFAAYGIDSCCGGDLPLATVCERHGLPLDDLLGALTAAAAA